MKRGRLSVFTTRLAILGLAALIAVLFAPRLMQETAIRWLGRQTGLEWSFRLDAGRPGSKLVLASEVAGGERTNGALLDGAAATLAGSVEARIAHWGWLDGKMVIERVAAREVHAPVLNQLLGPDLTTIWDQTEPGATPLPALDAGREVSGARAWVDSIAVAREAAPVLQFDAAAKAANLRWEQLVAELQPVAREIAEGMASFGQVEARSSGNPLREGLLQRTTADRVRQLNEIAGPLRARLKAIGVSRAADIDALTRARDADLALLQASFSAAPVLGRPELANEALLRPAATRLAGQLVDWLQEVRRTGELQAAPETHFRDGRTIRLPGSSAITGVEIRELFVEGTARLSSTRFEYVLTAHNLLSGGPTSLSPLKFTLRAQGPHHLLVEGSCGGPDQGQVHLTSSAIALPELRLGSAGMLEMETTDGSFSVDARLDWAANGQVAGEILLHSQHEGARVTGLHPLVSGLAGVTDFNLAPDATGFECRIGIRQVETRTMVTIDGGPGAAVMTALNQARQDGQRQKLDAALESVGLQYREAVAAIESRAAESVAQLEALLKSEATLVAELERMTPAPGPSTLRR